MAKEILLFLLYPMKNLTQSFINYHYQNNRKVLRSINFPLIGFILTCFIFLQINADSLKAQKTDTAKVSDTTRKKHSPKTATIMSAVLPGLGQAYNKKYWKIPIIYVGFGACAYFINFNTGQYNNYKLAYKYKNDNDPNTIDPYPIYTNEDILSLKNYYRRNLELSYIATMVVYLFNVLDASVDGNLYDFDVSEDLSLHVEPSIINTYNNNNAAGIKFTMSFNYRNKSH
jgi:hypothetical protein